MADPISLVVSPIINEILRITFKLLQDEFLLLWNVKADIENLSSKLTAIQATLHDAEERQIRDEHLRDWIRKLKNVADDAQDVLDTFATEMALLKRDHELRKLPTPASKRKILAQSAVAHQIQDISARLDQISKEKQQFHLNISLNSGNERSRSDDLARSDEFMDAKDVFGREDDKQKIIDLLMSSNPDDKVFSVIPIIGMGGLGKTTVAQLVYNDDRIKQSFDLSRMWVSVSVDFNITRILREMMESYSKMPLPLDLSPNLVKSRFRGFLPGKRFLLVLDDVWCENYDDWEPLLQLLELGLKGSKVLVTSRSIQVANVLGVESPHRMNILPKDECWMLFERIAFKPGSRSDPRRRDLEDIGKLIIAKCEGLPLAVKTMAAVLRGKDNDVEKWRRILKNDMWESKDQKILPALKLSYDHLPSYVKQCFAFCSIFPKAYTFDKTQLIKLWMAQTFVQTQGEISAEEIGDEYFDTLLMRSFFQLLNVNNRPRYKMHDLIHDLAQSISGSQYCQIKDSKIEDFHNLRHVSLLCQDVEESSLKIAEKSMKLRTLLLPHAGLKNFGQALDKLLHSLKYIRALDLSSSSLIELPSSIKECKLLRYLDLSNTEVRALPNSICTLYNLQTLKLLRCLWLFELPKDLGDLVNLRHLELDDMFWFKCTTLPPNIGNLKGLHNLHAFSVGDRTGYHIRELEEMANLTGPLHISNLENAVNAAEAKLSEKESLQKVVYEWTNREINSRDEAEEERMLTDLQPHSNLKEIVVSSYIGVRFPPWMNDGRLRNLVSISLNHCSRCKILSFDQLHSLSTLCIKDMEELDKLQCGPSLRSLKIINCPRLSDLDQIFPSVSVLKIKRCASLKTLPITPFLQFLILVDNATLEDWQEAVVQTTVINDRGDQVRKVLPSYLNLLEMKVINCPKLQGLPRVFAPQKLEISGCELLTALPAPEYSQRLQHLALNESNGTLLTSIPTSNTLYSLVISNMPNIVSVPKLPHLPGLKALYIHNCQNLVSLSEDEESFRSLTSLKLLSLRGCEKLKTLPNEGLPASLECLSISICSNILSLGNNETLKSLTSLKDLYIEDCPLIQSFPEDGLPSSLQHLCIQKCPPLTEKCNKETGSEWPKIAEIPDLEIDFVEPPQVIAPPLRKKKPWYQRHFACGKGY